MQFVLPCPVYDARTLCNYENRQELTATAYEKRCCALPFPSLRMPISGLAPAQACNDFGKRYAAGESFCAALASKLTRLSLVSAEYFILTLEFARLWARFALKVGKMRVCRANLISKHAGKRLLATQAYCVKCKAKREMNGEKAVTMKNGRNALTGTCSVCGTKMFKIGGGSGGAAKAKPKKAAAKAKPKAKAKGKAKRR